MEISLLIGSLILLVIVGFHAWFSYRILQEVRHENSLYRGAIERQLRLASLPHVYCDIQPLADGAGMHLGIYNIGNTPAYDVHIDIIGAYAVEGMDIPTFMRTFVQPRFRKYPLQPDKVGYYGVRNSARYPLLAYQKRLELPLKIPATPVDVYALLQYREVTGVNYHQVYCFSEVNEQGNYRANLAEPSRAEIIERLHFYDTDDAKISSQEKALPFALKAFIDLWNHSMSVRFTLLEPEGAAPVPSVQEI
ncbi:MULTISPECIES: hypothetical protein [unclassified Leptolyngbya]|uniref:hypothetical protein n=1 Tax=unclassified Leptolyngbya TaxID=2650499 RepID=UPI001687DEBF|nr:MULTISPECIES: hypothetical protein [unclassified Leptolyngbya]MBD1910866.1 hypothetical protein [Leptolyngbya sp. FACHB-8]MBD2153739.1 hypothetical protein [Leptolyngbya sp. FACHB-16]